MSVKSILATLGIDKYQHFALAAICAALAKTFLRLLATEPVAMIIAFIAVFACAVGKELIYDKAKGKGTPEWADLWAGVLGAVVGVA